MILIGSVLIPILIILAQMILKRKAVLALGSYSARGYDLIQGFKLFLQKPLLGWGYKNTEVFSCLTGEFANVKLSDRTCSNGVISALYQLCHSRLDRESLCHFDRVSASGEIS